MPALRLDTFSGVYDQSVVATGSRGGSESHEHLRQMFYNRFLLAALSILMADHHDAERFVTDLGLEMLEERFDAAVFD